MRKQINAWNSRKFNGKTKTKNKRIGLDVTTASVGELAFVHFSVAFFMSTINIYWLLRTLIYQLYRNIEWNDWNVANDLHSAQRMNDIRHRNISHDTHKNKKYI